MNEVTVPEAISKGQKQIALPLKIIMVLSIVIPIALIFLLNASWWYLLLLPVGLIIYFSYDMLATPKWRIWAYECVNDIHQFQRAAELEGLLMRQSHKKIEGYMTPEQKEKLAFLQQRFLEEATFHDDQSVPSEMLFYKQGQPAFCHKRPLLIIHEKGIQFEERYIEWSNIINERIVQISYDEEYGIGKPFKTAGSKDLFRYETRTELYEIPLPELSISAWKLDYLLYIYRGRHTKKITAQQHNQPFT